MIDLWFGDSYTVGSELVYHYGEYTLNDPRHRFVRPLRDRPDKAFPHLVSSTRGNDYINFGHGGSSIEWQLQQLLLFIKNEYKSENEYTAFFCLPFQTRRFMLKNQGTGHVWISKRGFWTDSKDLETIEHTTTLALNQIFLLCKQYNIKMYFMPIYCYIDVTDSVNIVPDDVWLIDRNSTLVEEAWGLLEPVKTWRDVKQRQNNSIFIENVSPCDNHPNLVGHQRIADLIVTRLTEKEKCKNV
jgi:hypothetical protein